MSHVHPHRPSPLHPELDRPARIAPSPRILSRPPLCLSVQSAAEINQVIELVTTAMAEEGYTHKDIFGMNLALEEALINAIKHGHRGDPSLVVRVHYHVTAEEVLAVIEDQGPGFDPESVADPLAPENRERPSGRGLLLMRHYLTGVRYNERGNAVTLRRQRSAC
ncbi:MAG TPA: ATP-binding protein [Gemmataceae bacterium]|nr:ATP-binding protein [Gemmataceae bacterium]